MFCKDFKDFTLETFNSLGRAKQYKLHYFLCYGSVYVCANTLRITIPKTFNIVLIEEE